MATYREKFGKYEIRIDGVVLRWFKSLEKAQAEFDDMAQYPDELEGTMTLVEIRTGEVLASVEPVEEAVVEEAAETIMDVIVALELPAAETRLEKLVELGAPNVMIAGQQKIIEDLQSKNVKIGGAVEKLSRVAGSWELKKGNGGKPYILFEDGTMYFPTARYGRYIK